MTRFTINDFRKQYSSDAVCLDKLFQIRYGNLSHCPECKCETEFRRIATRRAYQCKHCYAQFYPTAGTVFEKTRTPLSDWFYIIHMFTTTRNGVAAKEIERCLGVTYKTAWRMGHQIRILISGISPEMLHGFVDLDETYVGGKLSNKSKSKREELYKLSEGEHTVKGRNTDGKTPVFAMVERTGNVIAYVVPKIRKDAIYTIIKTHVDPTAKVSTDESRLYDNLEKQLGLEHGTVNHSMDEYRKGWFCTNSVEGYFAQLKRAIKGTHLHVSPHYLQNYVNECSFRFNHRKNPSGMFNTIIGQVEPVKY